PRQRERERDLGARATAAPGPGVEQELRRQRGPQPAAQAEGTVPHRQNRRGRPLGRLRQSRDHQSEDAAPAPLRRRDARVCPHHGAVHMAASPATPLTRAVLAVLALGLCGSLASADPLDTMALDRWAKLREAERFQLNAAERLYREQQWKAAADEYEKFLKLYE